MDNIATRRPAETVTAAFAVAAIIGRLLGLDDETVLNLAIVIGFIPAAVTWTVEAFRTPKPKPRKRRNQQGHGEVNALLIVVLVVVLVVVLTRVV